MYRIGTLFVAFVLAALVMSSAGCKKEGDTIIAGGNKPPEVETIPDQTATVNVPFALDLSLYVSDRRDDITSLNFYILSGEGSFTGSMYNNTFSSTGLKTVTFVVLDSESAGTRASFSVNVIAPPLADFVADVTYGVAPLDVAFTDLSTGDFNAWSWDFGDGGTNTEQNPAYQYTVAGLYDVTLTITGPGGTDALTKHSYIQVLDPAAGIWYVDSANTAATVHDGLAWDTAFLEIQSGIDAATDGDMVLVADGDYAGTSNVDLDFGGRLIVLKAWDYYGSGVCTIDCEDAARAFYFHSGETNEAVVDGFTIASGYTIATGGAFCLDASSPTISRCTITSCLADGGGGAIAFVSAAPVITGCTVSDNESPAGAGIFAITTSATTIISDGTFSGNYASSVGGAIFGVTVVLDIDHCTFTENLTTGDGGCLFAATSSDVSVVNCTMSRNQANTYGAGFYVNDDSVITVTGSTFTGNKCGMGAGIAGVLSSVSASNCTMSGNNCMVFGPGICAMGDTSTPHGYSLNVANCTFSDNSAMYGAITSMGTDTTINNCLFLDNEGMVSASLMFQGSDTDPAYFTTLVTNCTMTGNSAMMGGAVCGMYTTATIQDCTISNNYAGQAAGGMILGGDSGYSMVTIKDCTFMNNRSGMIAGALELQDGCDPATITGCTFSGNSTTNSGGAVDVGGTGSGAMTQTISFTNCEITDNSATIVAGGIYLTDYFDATITACTITGNSATQVGGGVYAYNDSSSYTSTLGITDAVIEGNTGGIMGGGLYAQGGYMALGPVSNCVISGNEAFSIGAGAYIDTGAAVNPTTPLFTNCLITDNFGVMNGGGINLNGHMSPIFTNCTIANNKASMAGGGFVCSSSNVTATLENCIIWGNTATTEGAQIYYGDSTLLLVSSDYSNASGDIGGTGGAFTPDGGCKTVNPLFVTGPKGGYYLSQIAAGELVTSECVNAGAGTLAAIGIDGKTTRSDGVIDTDPPDMGYHYDQ